MKIERNIPIPPEIHLGAPSNLRLIKRKQPTGGYRLWIVAAEEEQQ